MGNCLVTKLKGTVDNDNIPRLGESVLTGVANGINLRVHGTVSFRATSNILSLTEGGPYTSYVEINDTNETLRSVYINGTAEKLFIKGYDIATLYSFGASEADLSFMMFNTHGRLEAINQDAGIVTVPRMAGYIIIRGTNVQLEDVEYPYLTFLSINGSTGSRYSAEQFVKNMPNLESLYLAASPYSVWYGDFNLLGKLVHLIELRGGSSFEGSIEGFVVNARNAGRTTGYVDLMWIPNNITFNGSPTSIDGTITRLSWTDSTITLGDTTINA